MSPLRKYIPRQVPPAKLHPVDVMLNIILAVYAIGIIVCVFLLIAKT